MGFKWRTSNNKCEVLSNDVTVEIRKRIDKIAMQLIPNGDIPLPKWSQKTNLTKEKIVQELRSNIDYIKENNYCRQHSEEEECTNKFSTYDSSKFEDEQVNDLSSQFASAEYIKYNAECVTHFAIDDGANNGAAYGGY